MRYLIWALVLLALPAQAEVLKRLDFETGDAKAYGGNCFYVAGNHREQPWPTDRLEMSTEYAYEGERSFKATVKYGDLASKGARAECNMQPWFYEGDDVWYQWSTFFPPDFQSSPKWHIITQWHDNTIAVPMGFALHGERFSFGVNGSYYDRLQQWDAGTLWTAPLRRGHWYRFKLHVKWHRDWTKGYVQLWVDGEKVVDKVTATLDPEDWEARVYMQQGLYRDRTITHTQSLYHDDITVATSEADLVQPLADGGTSVPDAGTGGTGGPPGQVDGGQGQPEPDAGGDQGSIIVEPPEQLHAASGCETGGPGLPAWGLLVLLWILLWWLRRRQRTNSDVGKR